MQIWNQIKMKLKPIKIRKKGSVIDILVWLVVSFIIITFFGLWIYGFNLVTDKLTSINTGSSTINISDAAQKTFGQINPAQTKGLHTLAYVMIFIMGLSILVSNFLVKTHPAFFVVYLLIVIGAIISSVYISNQYESFLTNDVVGTTFAGFTGANFIMLYLPIWTTVIGLFGALFLFAGIMRDRGMGESIV